jgi:hypothetical protein
MTRSSLHVYQNKLHHGEFGILFGRKRGNDVLSNFDASPMLKGAETGKKKVNRRKRYETYI